MSSALLVGADFRYARQDAVSLADWGDWSGRTLAEMCEPFQPEEVIRGLILPTVERAQDTGELLSYDLPSRGGVGRTTVLRTREGLLTRWEWIEQPVIVSLPSRRWLEAEHLHRVAWAMREGRPLPHLPAALRPGRRVAPSGSRSDR